MTGTGGEAVAPATEGKARVRCSAAIVVRCADGAVPETSDWAIVRTTREGHAVTDLSDRALDGIAALMGSTGACLQITDPVRTIRVRGAARCFLAETVRATGA